MKTPLLTAIVSTYAAERFIRGCMDDLLAQTILPELEILVIDSGSPQMESEIVRPYVAAYPDNVRLIRTEREPLYVAWNRAIGIARGKYLTSANTDDRHRSDSFERLAAALDADDGVGLAYADQWISETENESFDECTTRGARRRNWPDFTHEDLMRRCITGSQPMWRRALHEELGVFNTRYRIAGDYEMWLRVASHYRLLHLNEVCGTVYEAEHTISGTGNRLPMNLEFLNIQRHFVRERPWSDIPNIRKTMAREIFGRGYQHISAGENPLVALPFFHEAIRLDPANLSYWKTYFIRCVLRRRLEISIRGISSE